MAKNYKLKINSVDYSTPKIEPRDNFKKENIISLIKINWKILLVFLIFAILFIIGITLTAIGLSNRTSPTDFGEVSVFSTLSSVGIIFILISLLSYVLLIPIVYRLIRKIIEKKQSNKVIKNR